MKRLARGFAPPALFFALFAATAASAGSFQLQDVDKPTGSPTSYDANGRFTNILGTWNVTCWEAVSASMLNFAGFGPVSDIYAWFYTTYGNVTATQTQWRDGINAYIAAPGHGSSQGSFVGAIQPAPTEAWAEQTFPASPIGLYVDIGGDYGGIHTVSYGGQMAPDVNLSWIADPDADWMDFFRFDYADWTVFDNMASNQYNWKLGHGWSGGAALFFDVEAAIYLRPVPGSNLEQDTSTPDPVPEPGTLALLLVGASGVWIVVKRHRPCSESGNRQSGNR